MMQQTSGRQQLQLLMRLWHGLNNNRTTRWMQSGSCDEYKLLQGGVCFCSVQQLVLKQQVPCCCGCHNGVSVCIVVSWAAMAVAVWWTTACTQATEQQQLEGMIGQALDVDSVTLHLVVCQARISTMMCTCLVEGVSTTAEMPWPAVGHAGSA
jgi:hypothetical protein